ncbi:MAG TPA: thioesterase II family protein, partial [Herpetosiphonaceae bacterium]
MMAGSINKWIVCSKPNPDASVRLFCFPFAGGGATVFRTWASLLPPQIEVCAVQLPGRETRMREPLFTSIGALVPELLNALAPALDMPFVFFGHSMGALISFELARALRRQGNPHLLHLFVSARSAPQVVNGEEPIYHLPTPEFIDKLRQLNGTPDAILHNPELQEMLLPILRADLALNERYVYTEEAPLDVPISAFGGLQDPRVRQENVAQWAAQTSKTFSLRMVAGDHFFLNANPAAIVQPMQQDLRPCLLHQPSQVA